jgi:hypothetical protein
VWRALTPCSITSYLGMYVGLDGEMNRDYELSWSNKFTHQHYFSLLLIRQYAPRLCRINAVSLPEETRTRGLPGIPVVKKRFPVKWLLVRGKDQFQHFYDANSVGAGERHSWQLFSCLG